MILLLAAPVAPTVALLTTGGSTVLAMAVVPLAVAARVTPTVAEPLAVPAASTRGPAERRKQP